MANRSAQSINPETTGSDSPDLDPVTQVSRAESLVWVEKGCLCRKKRARMDKKDIAIEEQFNKYQDILESGERLPQRKNCLCTVF